MANVPKEVARLRATIGSHIARDPSADTSELRRDLRAAGLEAHISRVVAEAPPLTDVQRSRLAALLAPGGDVG